MSVSIREVVRDLRKRQTEAEGKMWAILRSRKINGKIHDNLKERDDERTLILEEKGIAVIRFSNDDVMSNINIVMTRLHRLTTQ